MSDKFAFEALFIGIIVGGGAVLLWIHWTLSTLKKIEIKVTQNDYDSDDDWWKKGEKPSYEDEE